MALSLSGRKVLWEAAGFGLVVAFGAVVLTHQQQTKQLMAQALGLPPLPSADNPTVSAAVPDDGASKSSRSRSIELNSQRGGHFFAEAEINGRSVKVMVDTGASMVALTYDDARHAGILPRDSDFTGQANTANGIAKFAPIDIDRITIGDIEVRNVRAAVMEQGKLETTLLGMSFLGKLGSVAMKQGKLVLEE